MMILINGIFLAYSITILFAWAELNLFVICTISLIYSFRSCFDRSIVTWILLLINAYSSAVFKLKDCDQCILSLGLIDLY